MSYNCLSVAREISVTRRLCPHRPPAAQRRSNLGWRAGLTELGRLPHGTEMADGVGKVWLGRDRLHNTCVFSRYR
jgi:hypothetical protein